MSAELVMGWGVACVAWTAFEFRRLWWRANQSALRERVRSRQLRTAPGNRGFAAWDESGRPIAVEDLGYP